MVCIVKIEDVDQKLTDQGSSSKYISSHFEAYTCPIHEQVTGTKDLMNGRGLKKKQQLTNDNRCHLYKVHAEHVTHLISNCSKIHCDITCLFDMTS